jgi:hypothetical protein
MEKNRRRRLTAIARDQARIDEIIAENPELAAWYERLGRAIRDGLSNVVSS